MLIEITQEDINKARKEDIDFGYRALAFALKRQSNEIFRITRGWITFPHIKKMAYLPSEVLDFIQDLNSGKQVKPISFELNYYVN